MGMWDTLVYGSGDVEVGGSGTAPDGTDSKQYQWKYISEIAALVERYQRTRRGDTFKFLLDSKKREVEFASAWQDYHATLAETAGKTTRTAMQAKVDALGHVLGALHDWRGANDRRLGAFVMRVTTLHETDPSFTAEDAVYEFFSDLKMSDIDPGDVSLPEAIRELKRDLWGAAALDDQGRFKSFDELWSDLPGYSHLKKLALDWEEASRATETRTIAVNDQIKQLDELTNGAVNALQSGQDAEAAPLLDKAAEVVQGLPSTYTPPTLESAEEAFRRIQEIDPTSQKLEDLLNKSLENAGLEAGDTPTMRELMGQLVANPKFQKWAADQGYVIGNAEVETSTDGTLTTKSYVEGADDNKAALRFFWELKHPPGRRAQLYGSGKVGRVLVSTPDPAMAAQYTLATSGPLAGLYAFTDEDGKRTYVGPDSVRAALAAGGVNLPADPGQPEVFETVDADGTHYLRVGGTVYTAGEDGALSPAPAAALDNVQWTPVGLGDPPTRYLPAAGIRAGSYLPDDAVLLDTPEDIAGLHGDRKSVEAALKTAGITLSSEKPGADSWIYGEILTRDAGDEDGVVRMSTGDGYVVLGGEGQQVRQVEVLDNRSRLGLLSVQSRARGAKGEAKARAAETGAAELARVYGEDVPVIDTRTAGAKAGDAPRPPGILGRLVDATAGAFRRPLPPHVEPAPSREPKAPGAEAQPSAAEPAAPAETPAEVAERQALAQRMLASVRGGGESAAAAPGASAPPAETPAEAEARIALAQKMKARAQAAVADEAAAAAPAAPLSERIAAVRSLHAAPAEDPQPDLLSRLRDALRRRKAKPAEAATETPAPASSPRQDAAPAAPGPGVAVPPVAPPEARTKTEGGLPETPADEASRVALARRMRAASGGAEGAAEPARPAAMETNSPAAEVVPGQQDTPDRMAAFRAKVRQFAEGKRGLAYQKEAQDTAL